MRGTKQGSEQVRLVTSNSLCGTGSIFSLTSDLPMGLESFSSFSLDSSVLCDAVNDACGDTDSLCLALNLIT